MTNLDSILKNRDIICWKRSIHSKLWFPVVIYGCESWTIKKAECQRTVVLEKILESPLDCKEVQPVSPKGNQPWIFIGRTNAVAEAPILWPPDGKNWLIWKDSDAGKDQRKEEKETTEGVMVWWHHRFNRHEFEQSPGVDDGQEAWHAAVHRVTESNTT